MSVCVVGVCGCNLCCIYPITVAQPRFINGLASELAKSLASKLLVTRFLQEKNKLTSSSELRNGALQIWRGVVCFSRDFTFRINILNSISTPHKYSFFIITNVLSVSRDLPHPFLTFYFNPNLHHFINNTCNLIHFFSLTIDTKFMELIGVFLNYLRFVNYNVSC